MENDGLPSEWDSFTESSAVLGEEWYKSTGTGYLPTVLDWRGFCGIRKVGRRDY